jgi:LysR family glycine cleavage system transcriptional activator
MHHLPPLNALRAFETAARLLSFKRASEELCVTPGAISRHIGNLEQFLGIRLFTRQQRQTQLTEAGRIYLKEVHFALQHISQATDFVTAGQDERLLRLKVPPTFAVRWLVPRLAQFRAQHPNISVQIATSHDPVDFETDEVDAAVGYGGMTTAGLVAHCLFQEVLIPVCTSDHLAGARKISAEQLAVRMLLHSLRRPNDWPRWFAAAGWSGHDMQRALVFENSTMTYQGAIDGLGIAIVQAAFVADELKTGRLTAPTSVQVTGDAAYFLTYPKHAARHAKVRVFHKWIAEQAAPPYH